MIQGRKPARRSTVKRLNTWMMISILAGAFALTGCPPKKKLAIDEKATEEKTDENADANADANKNALQPGDVQIQQDWTEIPNLQTIQFGYDSANLDDSAR